MKYATFILAALLSTSNAIETTRSNGHNIARSKENYNSKYNSMVQLSAEGPIKEEKEDQNCPGVNWAECPGYMRE